MMSGLALVLLRDDLRLDDQPAIAGVADRTSCCLATGPTSGKGSPSFQVMKARSPIAKMSG
jgi:hypothetical protein